MIIVSDTSPLSNLFVINRLDILQKLYGRILVPDAVMNELLELEKRGIDLTEIKTASWIEIKVVMQREAVDLLLKEVDLGEAEAIVLAESLNAEWLLIDETKGRSIAKAHGLHLIGLLGILLFAKQQGIISAVNEILAMLIEKAKFRISKDLHDKILQMAGE